MSDRLCFVQFPHPGGEHGPDSEDGTLKAWERDTRDHARKFMVSPGAWRDDPDATTQKGEVVFWGEWECDSTVAPVEHRVPGGPHWLHRPFFEGLQTAPADAIRQNTDPFVFGDRFLYTYCRQPGNRKLRELADGSLILFGSKKSQRSGLERKAHFVLDTVLVVADSVLHTRDTYLDVAASRTNEVFRLTTLDPMYEQGTKGCRLYFGATADESTNGIFSFVPCMPARGQSTFARPVIELPEPFVKPNRTQQAGTIPVSDPAELTELWHRVVAQVIEQDCALGVRVDLPAERRAAAS